jgi:hypothetical protein
LLTEVHIRMYHVVHKQAFRQQTEALLVSVPACYIMWTTRKHSVNKQKHFWLVFLPAIRSFFKNYA